MKLNKKELKTKLVLLQNNHPKIKYIIPILTAIFFTYQININIDKKLSNDLVNLKSSAITTLDVIYTKQDKQFEKAITVLKKYQIYLDKRINIKNLNYELIKLEKELSKSEPLFNKYKKNYNLLKNEHDFFKRTFNYMTRVITIFKKKGLSIKWIIENQFKNNLTSAREKEILEVYSKYNLLTYHDIEKLSKFKFSTKPTHPLEIAGISFMDRVRKEMNYQKKRMLTHRKIVKKNKELILAYQQIKKGI